MQSRKRWATTGAVVSSARICLAIRNRKRTVAYQQKTRSPVSASRTSAMWLWGASQQTSGWPWQPSLWCCERWWQLERKEDRHQQVYHPNQQCTLNKLLIKFKCRNFANNLLMCINWACKSAPKMQKRVCILLVFQLGFYFAHQKWSGSTLSQ